MHTPIDSYHEWNAYIYTTSMKVHVGSTVLAECKVHTHKHSPADDLKTTSNSCYFLAYLAHSLFQKILNS